MLCGFQFLYNEVGVAPFTSDIRLAGGRYIVIGYQKTFKLDCTRAGGLFPPETAFIIRLTDFMKLCKAETFMAEIPKDAVDMEPLELEFTLEYWPPLFDDPGELRMLIGSEGRGGSNLRQVRNHPGYPHPRLDLVRAVHAFRALSRGRVRADASNTSVSTGILVLGRNIGGDAGVGRGLRRSKSVTSRASRRRVDTRRLVGDDLSHRGRVANDTAGESANLGGRLIEGSLIIVFARCGRRFDLLIDLRLVLIDGGAEVLNCLDEGLVFDSHYIYLSG